MSEVVMSPYYHPNSETIPDIKIVMVKEGCFGLVSYDFDP